MRSAVLRSRGRPFRPQPLSGRDVHRRARPRDAERDREGRPRGTAAAHHAALCWNILWNISDIPEWRPPGIFREGRSSKPRADPTIPPRVPGPLGGGWQVEARFRGTSPIWTMPGMVPRAARGGLPISPRIPNTRHEAPSQTAAPPRSTRSGRSVRTGCLPAPACAARAARSPPSAPCGPRDATPRPRAARPCSWSR